MDDGAEILLGWVVGKALGIRLIYGRGSDGVVTFDFSDSFDVHSNNAGYYLIVTGLSMALATVIFARKYNWRHWRSRLVSRYDKPNLAEPWQERIDEIGKE